MADPTFFPGRAARIIYRPKGNPPFSKSQMSQSAETDTPNPTSAAFVGTAAPQTAKAPSTLEKIKDVVASALPSAHQHHHSDLEIGVIGILHPSVLEKFEVTYPCSALEFTLEPFMKEIHPVWADDA